MEELTLNIEGMSCNHCVARVKKAIDATYGVVSSEVESGLAKVKIDETNTSRAMIEKAIIQSGYKVK
ncbi:MAG: heavy-metal-associated domain-containing protein [Nitrospirae bacterium]|nr:heavy-metal-associated domain-containing protein [Nitrospirota bacterium]